MKLYIIGILARIFGIIIPLLLGVAFLVLAVAMHLRLGFLIPSFVVWQSSNSFLKMAFLVKDPRYHAYYNKKINRLSRLVIKEVSDSPRICVLSLGRLFTVILSGNCSA
jgi:hypothetical protein